ncbi:MAG: isoleucine--tRNA ligase [Spirochaetia bacterium]|nr:isoleucine--tRNA ligase [Spirochaetia bacterium]
MFKPVDPKVSFPKMEEKIQEFWKIHDIFKKSIQQREGNEEYVFFDGPPFATGLPHFGHFVPGTIKDIIPRYQAMKGKQVHRRFGWDCHGLPVEYEMMKTLHISGSKEIKEYGVGKFNESCRSIVLRYTSEWEKIVTRMGRWVDFEHDYKTMDLDYMESIWWVFKRLYEKGLVYEGYNIMPYSPALATPLSNFEVNLGGYQEVVDPAVTVKFKIDGTENTFFLAWTTTPWTLPSNLALALGPDIDYVKVKDGEEYYILAEGRLSSYYKNAEDCEVVEKYKGKELIGITYEPLLPFFADLKKTGAFITVSADYVTVEDGSGIVHTAPGFGEDDYNVLKGTGIPVVCPIDEECKFTEEVPDWEGLFVKDADEGIIEWLKSHGKLVKKEKFKHSYPFCYRTKMPLIYRALSSWFVDVPKIKELLLNVNDQIKWVPEHLQKGRFGKWLEGAREWSISRNRFWGNPIPVWKSDSSDHIEVIGSKEELEKKSGHKIDDLHKHFIDDLTWPSPDGKGTMRRIPDVLDCWFESGSMPYAQNHYPFENKEFFEKNFPADFICEGLDQTRGWFYTLTILAAALFEEPAFKNVVVNGLVLASDGKKMSKSERNFTDPMDIINQFGADSLRFFLMNSAVVRAEDLKFSDEGVKEVLKNFIIPLWNAYSFFVTYANIDNYIPKTSDLESLEAENPLDLWIISESERMVGEVSEFLDNYDLQKSLQPIVKFIDLLNNWYIRRSRRRFWRSENDNDKKQAYDTIYSVLITLIKTAAPFVPFITEEIYINLRDNETMPESVHLTDYPVSDQTKRDTALEKKMEITRQAVTMGRALRSTHSLKTRQPLKTLYLVTKDRDERRILHEMETIIKEELNVKEVVYRENEEDLVEYKAKPNYKLLGKELGKYMKEAAGLIEKLSMEEIQSIMDGAKLHIEYSQGALELTEEKIVVQRFEKENMKVLNEGQLTVGLDSEITEPLYLEGLSRDIVRSIQNLRKDRNLDVTDRIHIRIYGEDKVRKSVQEFKDHIMNETLAETIAIQQSANSIAAQCGEVMCQIDLEKVQ